MATIFGNISGYSFSGIGTQAGGSTVVPAGQAWVAFYQGVASPGGMSSVGSTGGTGSLWIGFFGAGSTLPSVPTVNLIFVPIPTINSL